MTPLRDEEIETQHGIAEIGWDNIGKHFRGRCLCDWETGASALAEDIGADFDQHFINTRAVNAAARSK